MIERTAANRVFHSLDGLRGIAAVCVVMLHYGVYVRPLSIGSGYLAVDLFFALSGFVIGHAYDDRLKTSIHPAKFFLLRVVRLYPLYLVGTLLAIATPIVGLLLGVSQVWTWRSLGLATIPAILMIPGPDQAGHWRLLYPFNFPAWSLLFELIANVIYAVILWTKATRTGWGLAIVAVLGCVASVSLYGNIDSGPGWGHAWISLARVGCSFSIGVGILRLYRSNWLATISIPPIFVIALIAFLLVASPPLSLRGIYDLLCVMVIFPLAICACVTNEPHRGARVFSFLGIVSYPLYTIHQPASYVLSRFTDRLLHTDAAFYAPWIGIVMIVALAGFSFLLAKTYDPFVRNRLGGWLLPPSPNGRRLRRNNASNQ